MLLGVQEAMSNYVTEVMMQEIPRDWIGKKVMFPVNGAPAQAAGILREVNQDTVTIEVRQVSTWNVSNDEGQTWEQHSREEHGPFSHTYERANIGEVQLRGS